ncbi:hypothetical protein ACSMEV_15260 [Pseudomonas sp. MLB6B]
MKRPVCALAAAVILAGCAAQPEKPVMQAAQYRAIALSSTLGEQCAAAGMMDVDLAAAGSRMLKERTAEFDFDPSRLQNERQQAALEIQRQGTLTRPACDALAYEVMRLQAVRGQAGDVH